MTIKALSIHFLKYLAGQNGSIPTGEIISRMLGYPIKSKEVIEELTSKNYVRLDNDKIEISNLGRDFITVIEKQELERIGALVHDNYDLALVGFLYYRNDFIQIDDFPEILRTLAPQKGNAVNNGNLRNSLFRMRAYIEEKHNWYVINDIGKSYYQSQIAKRHRNGQSNGSTQNGSTTGEHASMNYDGKQFDIPELTPSLRLWLSELFDMITKGQRVSSRQIWSRLGNKLARDYDPSKVDERLMSPNGEEIRILGVIALQGNFDIVARIDHIINCIRNIILADENKEHLTIDEIAQVSSLMPSEVSVALELARHYVNFYNKSGYKENSRELISIEIGGNEAIFYNYLHYSGILPHVMKAHAPKMNNSAEYFSTDEISEMNEKLDWLIEQMKTVILSAEFTYNDVMEEINELKSMYGTLKKKNWTRLLVAKLADMTGSGMVSSIISEPLSDIIKPEIYKLISS